MEEVFCHLFDLPKSLDCLGTGKWIIARRLVELDALG